MTYWSDHLSWRKARVALRSEFVFDLRRWIFGVDLMLGERFIGFYFGPFCLLVWEDIDWDREFGPLV